MDVNWCEKMKRKSVQTNLERRESFELNNWCECLVIDDVHRDSGRRDVLDDCVHFFMHAVSSFEVHEGLLKAGLLASIAPLLARDAKLLHQRARHSHTTHTQRTRAEQNK